MQHDIRMREEILRRTFGYGDFREGQAPLIDALLAGRDALGVMPTGAGKSLCFQIPALMFPGVTLVISPLISLMKDQVTALKQTGVAAAFLNSSLTEEQSRLALRRAAEGWYKIIYVAPERLAVESFLAFARSAPLDLVAVDEAHCVSQWGQDFRPSYLKIAAFLNSLRQRPVVGAFTATATSLVRQDIVRLLGLNDPLSVTTGFDRPNLYFDVRKPKDKTAALLRLLSERGGRCGIVYCATRKKVEEVCETLVRHGYPATRYHAGLSEEERRTNQDDFQYDRKAVMVATNAFGMGIDKSNVSFVIHYNMPKNLESYYQEAGRAGRDGSPADCVLLYSGQDVITARWMIEHADVNAELTDAERASVREKEQERLRQMTFYSTTKDCLRRFIRRYFGESAPERCENCSVCNGVEVFDETEAVAARTAVPKRASARDKALPYDETLFASLKVLRGCIATRLNIPAYVVFADTTLRDMARRRPTTREAMLRVNGVGEVKFERYGKAFLAVCEGCKPEDALVEHSAKSVSPAKPRKEKHSNAYAPWNAEEDEQLREEYDSDMAIGEISKAHGRSRSAIHSRLVRLGLLDDSDT